MGKIDVHSLTVNYPHGTNTILTDISVSPYGENNSINCKGLWDTGATHSAITHKAAQALGLKPMGVVVVNGVHGAQQANAYFITVTLQNRNVKFNLKVSECSSLSADDNVVMLIGMDIINQGDFAVTNMNGQMKMSYRTPSIQHIDFVKSMEQSRPYISTKLPSRNGKCNCGSGKKYKHCCGK